MHSVELDQPFKEVIEGACALLRADYHVQWWMYTTLCYDVDTSCRFVAGRARGGRKLVVTSPWRIVTLHRQYDCLPTPLSDQEITTCRDPQSIPVRG
jgi:hypothetical protein